MNDGKNFDVDANLDLPWILPASDHCKTWRNDGDVTVKLSEFGGAYKKAPSYKVDGRVTAPVAPKGGRDQAETLMNAIFPSKKRQG